MAVKKKLYLETTIPSYIAARSSRDIIVLAHQQITQEWWEESRNNFKLFISQIIIEEIKAGDKSVADARFLLIKGLPILDLTDEIEGLASKYMKFLRLPTRFLRDAFHIAYCVGYQMDYLLTWNCTHLANEIIRNKLHKINDKLGYSTPAICTPEELVSNNNEVI